MSIVERPSSPDSRDLVFASQSLVRRGPAPDDWHLQTTLKKLTLVKDVEKEYGKGARP